MKFIFINLLSIAVCFNQSYSQEPLQNSNTLKCLVIDSVSEEIIPFANVFNESEKTWVYAKESGQLTIWASGSDTLAVSAVGYYDKVVILNDSLLSFPILTIPLEPRIYEIGEATILGIKSYSQFKQEVINLDLPKTELDSVTEHLAITSKKVIKKAVYDKMVDDVFARDKGTLFMIGSSFKTKKQKDKINLNKKTNLQLIHQKYNREIVQKLTHLSDQETDDFMAFCNFSNEFIEQSTEYEIAEAINKKLNDFKLNNTPSD